MEISKQIQTGWNLKVKAKGQNVDQIQPLLEVGITLKFTETNLFLIKMDYFYTGEGSSTNPSCLK